MPILMNSPSASIVATPVGADCSSSASCSTRSLPHPLDIGLHALALKHKTTTCSGHCTQAATPHPKYCFSIAFSTAFPASTPIFKPPTITIDPHLLSPPRCRLLQTERFPQSAFCSLRYSSPAAVSLAM